LESDNFDSNTADTLYVPAGCAEVYRNTASWNDVFTSIVEQP